MWKHRITRAFLGIFCFGLFLAPAARAQDGDGSDPLLYYYSQADAAFVIETASGQQREILAPFTLRDDFYSIFGPGWSPSGEWFAWTEARQGATITNGFYTRRGMGTFQRIFDAEGSVGLSWSPTDDLLLATNTVDYREVEITVFDPENGPVYTTRSEYQTIRSAGWLPDGDAVYISEVVGPEESLIRVIALPQGDGTREFTFRSRHSWCAEPVFSPAGFVLYQNRKSGLPVVSDVSGVTPAIGFDSGFYGEIFKVYWHADGSQAILYSEANCNSIQPGQMWFLDIAKQELVLLARRAPYPWPGLRADERFSGGNMWSPDENYFAFAAFPGLLQIVSPNNLDTAFVDLGPTGEVARFWWISESELLLEVRSDDGDMFYTLSSDALLDEATHQLARIDVRYTINITLPAISNDGSALAFGGSDCDNVCIASLETGELIRIIDVSIFAREYVWSPDDVWLLVLAESVNESRIVFVTDVMGTVKRELGQCLLVQSCFGWLPEG